MPVWKVDVLFEYGKEGWSTGFFNEASTKEQVREQTKNMLAKYLPLLGLGIKVTGIRISDVLVSGDAVPYPDTFQVVHEDPAQRPALSVKEIAIPAAMASPPDPRWTALLIDEAGESDDVHNSIYMRGIPDFGYLNPSQHAFSGEWGAAYDNWVTEMTLPGNSWVVRGWSEPEAPPPLKAGQIEGGGSNRATVISTIPEGVLPVVNARVRLSGAPGVLKLNGVYTVTKIVGRAVHMLPDRSVPSTGGLVLLPLSHLHIRTLVTSPLSRLVMVKFTRRKVGRPSDAYRGRQKSARR